MILAGASPLLADPVITGRATVVDGDTIDVGKVRVRFNGVDAPERRQICQDAAGKDYRCGQVAALALDEWLAQSRPIRCKQTGRHFERIVADCWRADGAGVQAWLVRNGHALDWPRYSKGGYAQDQAEARAAKVGIWQGSFVEPWNTRKQKRP